MIKLKIINIDGYIYNLKDTKENNYTLNLEFFDIDKKPQIGDYIYVLFLLWDISFLILWNLKNLQIQIILVVSLILDGYLNL